MELKQFKNPEVFDVKEMDTFQVYGYVISQTGLVEKLVDGIITKAIEPNDVETFKDVILDSQTMPWRSKIKILKRIIPESERKNSLIQEIEDLVAIRNLFAHHNIYVLSEHGKKFDPNKISSGKSIMKKVSKSGILDQVSAMEKAIEFQKLADRVIGNLMIKYHKGIHLYLVPDGEE